MGGAERPGLLVVAQAAFAALAVFAWTNAGAHEERATRHRELDGKGAVPVTLNAVERAHRQAEAALARSVSDMDRIRTNAATDGGHHAGLKACFARRERTHVLPTALPQALRGRTLAFVTAPRAGALPRILAAGLDEGLEILVVEAGSLADVAALARAARRPVSLASADVARALGVECRDAVVTVSEDGTSVLVEEVRP